MMENCLLSFWVRVGPGKDIIKKITKDTIAHFPLNQVLQFRATSTRCTAPSAPRAKDKQNPPAKDEN